MRRADRMLQIIQILRRHRRPVTARALADELEVSLRTIYRDMSALDASGVPVAGEAGVGYVLGEGYDLPPLMFNVSELEAIMLGARLVEGRGDVELARGARDVVAKVSAVLHPALRPVLLDAPLFAPSARCNMADQVDAAAIRQAIREGRKIEIAYVDEAGRETWRRVWPIAVAYFESARLIAAWCELRQAFRHFRTDRIRELTVLDERYPARRAVLVARWKRELADEAGENPRRAIL